MNERDQYADRDGRKKTTDPCSGVWKIAEHREAATPQHQRDGEGAEELDHRVVERVGKDGVGPRLLVFVIHLREVVEGARLAIEKLHDAHAGDVLLGEGIDLCGRGTLASIAAANGLAEDGGRDQDQRDGRERKQGQRPGHRQHDANDEEQQNNVLEDREYARGEHLVQCIDVGGDARDEAADRVFIEEADILELDVAKNFTPKIEHDLLPGPLHEVGLDKLKAERDDERCQVQKGKFGDAGEGNRGEMSCDPGLVRLRRHVSIDRDLDQKRTGDVGRSLQQNGKRRAGDLQLVGG